MRKTTRMAHFGFSLIFCSLAFATQAINPPPSLSNSNITLPLLTTTSPRPTTSAPNPPSLDGKGWILMDAYSGKVLAAQNADQRLQPASLTKMMTAYIISAALQQGRIHLDDKVPVSEKAWRTGGSKMFVKVGTLVPVRDLLQGIIVQSGNDACIAMAEYIAGSEEGFVDLMNQQAKLLGMNNTHFTDSTGMPNPNHYTTPHDLAILARAIVFNFPDDYKTYSQKWFTYNNIKQPNRNRLLWSDSSVDGIKTGHTDDAGFCLAASALRNNMRLISIVMGEPNDKTRAADSAKLLNYGFRFYETKPLFVTNQPVENLRVWLGKDKTSPIGVMQNVYITVPNGQFKNIKTVLVTPDVVKAPLIKNQVVGQIKVTLNNETLLTEPAIALKDNPKANIITRLRDHTHLALEKFFNGSKKKDVKA